VCAGLVCGLSDTKEVGGGRDGGGGGGGCGVAVGEDAADEMGACCNWLEGRGGIEVSLSLGGVTGTGAGEGVRGWGEAVEVSNETLGLERRGIAVATAAAEGEEEVRDVTGGVGMDGISNGEVGDDGLATRRGETSDAEEDEAAAGRAPADATGEKGATDGAAWDEDDNEVVARRITCGDAIEREVGGGVMPTVSRGAKGGEDTDEKSRAGATDGAVEGEAE